MAQSCKRKTKASVSISSDSDICSPEGKKACNSPRSEPNIGVVFSEDDQVLEKNLENWKAKLTTSASQWNLQTPKLKT